MRTFTVSTCPFGDGMRLYSHKDITFKPGFTTLVGCNGSGKTTLMMLLKEQLECDKNVLLFSYNDRQNGGSNLMEAMTFYGDMSGVANMFSSSEGERIIYGVGNFAKGLRHRIKKSNPKEVWILLDAVGSGLSIDGIRDIKDLANAVIEDNTGIDVYFVVSTNEYEFSIGCDSIDVTTFSHITFDDYTEYQNFILKTYKKKQKRYKHAVN